MGFYVSDPLKLWPSGIIKYEIFLPAANSSDAKLVQQFKVVELIQAAMAKWQRLVNSDGITHIQFVESKWEKVGGGIKKINLALSDTSGSGGNGYETGVDKGEAPWSIAYAALEANPNRQSIKKQIKTGNQLRSIPHELGHLLGLGHENDRNGLKGDDDKANAGVDSTVWKEPADVNVVPWPAASIPRMCPIKGKIIDGAIAAAKKTNLPFGAYDLWSIMHYPFDPSRYEWSCDASEVKEYLRHNEDPRFRLPHDANEQPIIQLNELKNVVLNYPSRQDIENDTWMPSEGDILTLRHMYPGPVQVAK